MRKTIQNHNTVLLPGKLIYLVTIFFSSISPAQSYTSYSTIITNTHEIYLIKLETPAVIKNNTVFKNGKLLKPRTVIDARVCKQVKLNNPNLPNQFYHNNTSNYFIFTSGKSQEAITPTTQPNQWIAFLHNVDLHHCFTDNKCSNLTKYKEEDIIFLFHKITLARPPPAL